MSWRDRASSVTPEAEVQPAPQSGGWRSRAAPSTPETDTYWSDVKKNAIEGAKQIPGGIFQTLKTASLPSPLMVGRSVKQAVQGTPMMETDLGQDAAAKAELVKSVPAGIWQGVKDTAKVAVAPLERVTGTPWSQTAMGRTFRERPLSMPVGVASTMFPIAKGFRGARAAAADTFAGAEPNILERAGARGINDTLGIRPQTIEKMTPKGQNPGDYGVKVGAQLGDEGASGLGPTKGYTHVSKMADQHGQEVQAALGRIKKANSGMEAYPELGDSLKVEANNVLKPLLDRANELRDSSYPADKFESRYQRAAYNSLAKAAENRGGFLELDDVRAEMKKVGKMMKSSGEQHLPVIKKLYGHLADLQDSMVQDIADRSGDPKLSGDLLKANSNYSRYIRLLPDVKKAAAKESVGKTSFFKNPWDVTVESLEPRVSQLTFKAGRAARRLFKK